MGLTGVYLLALLMMIMIMMMIIMVSSYFNVLDNS
jgi:hypothetical protein